MKPTNELFSFIADNGVLVFPLQSGTKKPAVAKNTDWRMVATTDTRQIDAWLTSGNDLGAIVPAGYMVLDVDVDDETGTSGFETLEGFESLPETRSATTPRGGQHNWFKLPDGLHVRCATNFRPGLDIKASGNGYVKIHGDNRNDPKHPSTKTYAQDYTYGVAEAPEWLLEEAKAVDRSKVNAEDGESSAVILYKAKAVIEFNKALEKADALVESGVAGWDDAASDFAWYTAHLMMHGEDVADRYLSHTLVTELDADNPDHSSRMRGSDKLADKLAILQPQYANFQHDREEANTEFWASTEILTHIKNHSANEGSNPWAVLGNCLALVIACTPPTIKTDSYKRNGTLNFALATTAKSGAGKGTSWSAARSAFQWPDYYTTDAASGEAIGREYQASTGKGANKSFEMIRDSVFFRSGEIGEMGAKSGRSGSTLFERVKSAWSGEALKSTSIRGDSDINLEHGTYRFVFGVDVQPAKSDILFNESDGGLPQRFLWSDGTPVANPITPLERARMSRANKAVDAVAAPKWVQPWSVNTVSAHMELPECAFIDIEAHELAGIVSAQNDDDDDHRPHEMYTRIKVASGLALLHGDKHVSELMWALSKAIIERSNEVEGRAKAALARNTIKELKTKGRHSAQVRRFEEEETVKLTAKAMTNEQYKEHLLAVLRDGGATNRREFQQNHFGSASKHTAALQELEAEGQIVSFKDPENTRKTLIKAA